MTHDVLLELLGQRHRGSARSYQASIGFSRSTFWLATLPPERASLLAVSLLSFKFKCRRRGGGFGLQRRQRAQRVAAASRTRGGADRAPYRRHRGCVCVQLLRSAEEPVYGMGACSYRCGAT